MEKIRYSNLSAGLKVFVVFGWIICGINALAFTIAFIAGVMGA